MEINEVNEEKIKQRTDEYRITNGKLKRNLIEIGEITESFLKTGTKKDADFLVTYIDNFNSIGATLEDFPINITNYFNERETIIKHYLAGEITLEETRKYWEKEHF